MKPLPSDMARRARDLGLHARTDNVPAMPLIASPPVSVVTTTCEPTAQERARIVGICLCATRDRDAAEDLAQETLLLAWRHWHKLRDPDDWRARARWLAAIAVNVCRRWARSSGRELAHSTRLVQHFDEDGPENGVELLADEGDALDTELEHAERAQLLDRALGLLPPETREVLVERYLLELPLAEIAARHGLSAATLSVRLHRGKQALRAHLATTLRAEALAYGLLSAVDETWQETRIWCPLCGRTRLRGQLGTSPLHLLLRCPHCADVHSNFIAHDSFRGTLEGVQTFKVALNRVMAWADPYYRGGTVAHEVLCRCGRSAPVIQETETFLSSPSKHSLRAICSCHAQNHTDIASMALFTQEGRRFWRAHPRISLRPEYTVEASGREVIVVRYQSVAGYAALDTLFARETYELLSVHESLGA